jgi:hypothetical protein
MNEGRLASYKTISEKDIKSRGSSSASSKSKKNSPSNRKESKSSAVKRKDSIFESITRKGKQILNMSTNKSKQKQKEETLLAPDDITYEEFKKKPKHIKLSSGVIPEDKRLETNKKNKNVNEPTAEIGMNAKKIFDNVFKKKQ